MGQNWEIDPTTGDYIMQNGAPIETDSLTIPAYYRLKIERTQWMYAPDDQYGSDFYTQKKRFTSNDVNPYANIADQALQPMIDDGRAVSVTTDFLAPLGRNDVELSTTIIDAQGQPQTLNLPMVGGSV